MHWETVKSWIRFYVALYWLILLAFVILVLALVVFAFTQSSMMFPFVLASLWYISVRALHYHHEQKAARSDRSPKEFANVYHVYTTDAEASINEADEDPDETVITEYRILDFSRNVAKQIPVIRRDDYPYLIHLVRDADGDLYIAGTYDLDAMAHDGFA